jgi:hypothetical protein
MDFFYEKIAGLGKKAIGPLEMSFIRHAKKRLRKSNIKQRCMNT